MYIVAVHYLSSTITVFLTVRWNFILHVFDVNLHHYYCCHYKQIRPHPDMKYYTVSGKPLCRWLCLSVRNFVRLYLFSPIVFAWDITLCTGKKGWFSPLRGKTFWGYVKYIFSVPRYAVVEVPALIPKVYNCELTSF